MNNPEWQRQVWLNWRASLWGWSALLVTLVIALALVLMPANQRLTNTALVAIYGLWGATALYGAFLAARSLREEAHEHTWDWQRLSSLGPWRMAWGKLLGATLPAWLYAGWFALVALVLTQGLAPALGLDASRALPDMAHSSLHMVALALLWGVALQAWAMNSVLLQWQPGHAKTSRRLSFVVTGLLAIWLALLVARNLDRNDGIWWGWDVDILGLAWLGGLVALALGLLALWRQLAEQLDVATLPWAWPLGLVVAALFTAGLDPTPAQAVFMHICMASLAGTVLVALQRMGTHAHAWRQVQWCVQRGNWHGGARALPLWPVSWLLAAVAAWLNLAVNPHADLTPVALCLQVLRDMLLLTGFALMHRRLKSPLTVFVITWLVLNVALPMLAHGVGLPLLAGMLQPVSVLLADKGDWLLAPYALWVFALVQVVLVAAWVAWLFRREVLAVAMQAQPGTATS